MNFSVAYPKALLIALQGILSLNFILDSHFYLPLKQFNGILIGEDGTRKPLGRNLTSENL